MPTISGASPAEQASAHPAGANKAQKQASNGAAVSNQHGRQAETLVKYDNPVNVTDSAQHSAASHLQRQSSSVGAALKTQNGPLPLDGKNLAAFSNLHQKDADAVLRSILPAKEWTEGQQRWMQQISSTPATRLDVLALQEQLDFLLQKHQARDSGVCPIRRNLYAQALDEVIRQITISCQERGLLLLRIRDEMNLTINAYRALYESSVAFGMRKALGAEGAKDEASEEITKLKSQVAQLENQLADLKTKHDATEKREADRRHQDEKRHTEEMAHLEKINAQLKTQLQAMTNYEARKIGRAHV